MKCVLNVEKSIHTLAFKGFIIFFEPFPATKCVNQNRNWFEANIANCMLNYTLCICIYKYTNIFDIK